MSRNKEHRPNGPAAEGGRPIGSAAEGGASMYFLSDLFFYIMNSHGYSLYIYIYIYRNYIPVFHIFFPKYVPSIFPLCVS